jgi:hypothetical protein
VKGTATQVITRISPSGFDPADVDVAHLGKRLEAMMSWKRTNTSKALTRPHHEFTISFEIDGDVTSIADGDIRVFGHEHWGWPKPAPNCGFGLITIWQGCRLIYHLCVVLSDGILWEDVAARAFDRWFDTMPEHARIELGVGSGKSAGSPAK